MKLSDGDHRRIKSEKQKKKQRADIFFKGARGGGIFQRYVELFSAGALAKLEGPELAQGDLKMAQGLPRIFACGQMAAGLRIRSPTPPRRCSQKERNDGKEEGHKEVEAEEGQSVEPYQATVCVGEDEVYERRIASPLTGASLRPEGEQLRS